VGFSYYNAIAVDRNGAFSPYPADARIGPLGYAPWSEGLMLVLQRLAEDLPGRPLLIAEHGIGTDDDAWRESVLRESLGLVQQAIDQFERQHTVLVIAHRLSTIVKADLICVLEKGQIVEQGNHQELLEKHGIYAGLWRQQVNTESRLTSRTTG
jgi:hypothetical protein